MKTRMAVCLLALFSITGCFDDDKQQLDDQQELVISDTELSLRSEFSAQDYLEDPGFVYYTSGNGVEIVYNTEFFAYRFGSSEEWTVELESDYEVYRIGVISSQHWVRSGIAPGGSYFDREVALEETRDGGATWNEVDVNEEDLNLGTVRYDWRFAYDFANNRLFATNNNNLMVADLPIENFTLLDDSPWYDGWGDLIQHQSRDEIWLIGTLDIMTIGGTPVDTAYVRKFSVSDGVSLTDMTDRIGMSRVSQGLILNNHPDVVLVLGSDGVVRTEDGGSSWVSILESASSLSQSTNGDRIFALNHPEDGKVEIYCSQVLGDSWVRSYISGPADVEGYRMYSKGDELTLIARGGRVFSLPMSDVPCNL
ncbi:MULTISPECIES: hypothetical protein [Gammaproteobacteria]|uniref:hypothetical protein n=1 Tax=Gammaproteobacteria TaxID=1236 RepID=UPI000DD0A44E|nr:MULTISPECIES: hypothetical protein [Gammaproteobacteria]RTE86533.1 hypothetical protein DQX04_08225 [Aliidiomarina sp. B3213]TCZ90912.1 hypothetical protein EYQ95_08820 [Lysobacter sp. N42]